MLRPIQFPSTLRPPQPPGFRGEGGLRSQLGLELGPTARVGGAEATGKSGAPTAPSMLDLLVDQASQVNEMQHDADSMVHEMLTGGNVQSAEVLTAVQKADMAFRTMLQVRNKLLEAYREIMQMQV
ncbi:flagellar hook-basal body complex protein FliE [Candidatus Laterigemmans baculatus]|uniref:flagellar hook-basal body complex protein FliE n=1 Tax=Candidatus Laterigemmans baculatus TaxID=2770505 RepID=UPI0013DAEBBA|nr:flagellar hook-basal body complex protein FliE [Candidatus Laterigemmans baculatus]